MFDSIKEGYERLKQRVTEGVILAEKLAKLDGPAKRRWVISYVDNLIPLPEPWETIINVDGMIIGILVDRAVATLNALGVGEIATEANVQAVAAVLDAPHKALAAAASEDLTLDERLDKLFDQYGISRTDVSSGIVAAPVVKPVPTLKEPGQTEAENWKKCEGFVLAAEGGFVDHPSDKGGKTNMGITEGTLASAIARGFVPVVKIENLTKEQASHIYHEMYWKPSVADEIRWTPCYLFYDAYVNGGLGMASRVFQEALNNTFGSGLDVDGKWGPKTNAEIIKRFGLDKAGDVSGDERFGHNYLLARKGYYDRIITRNPSQLVFRNGWYNRLRNLAKACGLDGSEIK